MYNRENFEKLKFNGFPLYTADVTVNIVIHTLFKMHTDLRGH